MMRIRSMLLERPVVATDCRPLARILESTAAGLIYRSGDAASLVVALEELRSADRRATLGHNGRGAVLQQYNWERTAESLLGAYATLAP